MMRVGLQVTNVRAWRHLGVDPNMLRGISTVRLEELKKAARDRFCELAIELHPDKTGGDERKLEALKVLSLAHDEIKRLKMQPAPPPRPMAQPFSGGVVVIISGGPGFNGFCWSGSGNTTTGGGGGW